ncbi:hypothetical protein HYU93_03185 [Candidatus Daviesbacteria bacterium]|nr:hypothetical protein [Candidatus Daviesbacteria bacterium]
MSDPQIETVSETGVATDSSHTLARKYSRGAFLRGAARLIEGVTAAIALGSSPLDLLAPPPIARADSGATATLSTLPDGIFYAEAGKTEGFAVTGAMAEALEQLGGIDKVGPPISREYDDPTKAGRRVQFFNQLGIQITPGTGQRKYYDVYVELTKTKEGVTNVDLIPPSLDWKSDEGKPWGSNREGPNPGTVEANHIDTVFGLIDPQYRLLFRTEYFKSPEWLNENGLPIGFRDYGDVAVLVCQRRAFQLWKKLTPWTTTPGQIVSTNGGLDAKKGGLIPQEALAPQKRDGVGKTNNRIIEQLTSVETPHKFINQVGWAYTAHLDVSQRQMEQDFREMKDSGINVVYIGHGNPGEVLTRGEIGLVPAVFFAKTRNTAKAGDAGRIHQAITNALEAARTTGMNLVLPVGYQIQMGTEWNAANPAHLRRNPDGSFMDHWGSGKTASPYSPEYRADITTYYRWINDTFLRQNPNVLALNLGDEPMGSDFSVWAKQEFRRRHGNDFEGADDYSKGKFLSEVLADHARWSAELWQHLNRKIKVLFTFHIQRNTPYFPNFEAIFRYTPDNFVFSADTHLHDAPSQQPLTEQDKNLLCAMVRTLGWYSQVYKKPLMLWTAANAWGLANESSNPGGVSEAKENLRIVTDLTKQNGGFLAMVMAWGWNIEGQGVRHYSGPRPYSPEDMINEISSDMAARRDNLSTPGQGRPDVVLYVPAGELYARVGQVQAAHLLDPALFSFLDKHDFRTGNIIWATDGPALETAKQAGSKIVPISLQ